MQPKPKLSDEQLKRLKANSENWQAMMDILTEEAMMSEDAARMYLVLNNYIPEREDYDE